MSKTPETGQNVDPTGLARDKDRERGGLIDEMNFDVAADLGDGQPTAAANGGDTRFE